MPERKHVALVAGFLFLDRHDESFLVENSGNIVFSPRGEEEH